ncbi:hypothetical protein BDV11DRAFT_210559 [Aspergillus similis]
MPPKPCKTNRNLTIPTPGFFKPRSIPDSAAAPVGAYFFYGTLADPALLAEILDLDSLPELRPARIFGYKVKLWGQYPAVISVDESPPGTDSDCVVEGFVYRVERVQHVERLAEYETGNYRPGACLIVYTDGPANGLKGRPFEEQGYVFQYVGNMNELNDGVFDLGAWFKLMGRDATVGSETRA